MLHGKLRIALLTAALGLAPFAAIAQDSAPAQAIELGVEQGQVLVSTGGEFVQAAPGQSVAPGDRIMLTEGAAATLGYANGCSKAMREPGVYTVSPDCAAGGSEGTGPSGGMIAAIAGGVAVIAAAAGGGGGGGNDRPPPVSR